MATTTTTQASAPARARTTSRLVAPAPIADPDRFARAVAAVSGHTVLADRMRGFLGRNDNWLVPTAEGKDLFVKCLRGARQHVDARLARLLHFESLLADNPPQEFRTAPFHGVDRELGLLVFDCLADSHVSSERLADGELDGELVRRFGRIVAEIHRLPGQAPDADDLHDAQAGAAFYALSADGYANCSGGEVEAWAMLQHDKRLVQGLDDLRAMSARAPVVASHGDLRLDQFLLAGDEVYVVDWEEFRYTDPARDLGAVVGEFLHHAAARMFSELDVDAGLAPGAAHEAVVATGEREFAKVVDHVRGFWAGYCSGAEVDDELAVRTTGYAGWHFFDRLLAGAVHGARLTAAERGMAGIGRNAVVEPHRYAATIGLTAEMRED